ncbi:MAG TPA: hypothetical protein DEB10_05565, partial [Ruminococcaceae bacterium]|nr:hypothetical protein [Oscillospiraceae bacterium]
TDNEKRATKRITAFRLLKTWYVNFITAAPFHKRLFINLPPIQFICNTVQVHAIKFIVMDRADIESAPTPPISILLKIKIPSRRERCP